MLILSAVKELSLNDTSFRKGAAVYQPDPSATFTLQYSVTLFNQPKSGQGSSFYGRTCTTRELPMDKMPGYQDRLITKDEDFMYFHTKHDSEE
jgi:hypothetical protein